MRIACIFIFTFTSICSTIAQYDDGRVIYEDGNGLTSIDIIISADFDQDGKEDVLYASHDTGRLAWFKNFGDGVFSAEMIIDGNAGELLSMEAVDLNGDNLPDILATDFESGKVLWYANLGQGQFGPPSTIYINPPYTQYSLAADIDNDGDNDVVIRHGSGGFYWHENDGAGNFVNEHLIATGGLYSPLLTDLDNDGQVDLVCGGTGDKVYSFKNENGIFSLLSIIQSTVNIELDMYAHDIDGDTDTDILVTHYIDGEETEFLCFVNEGEGLALAPPVSLGVISCSSYPHLLIADLNDDGLPDIAPLGTDIDFSDFSFNATICLYENSGAYSFLDNDTIVQSDIYTNAIAVGDLNGDQKTDLIFANYNRINWIDNSAFTDGYSGMGLVSDSGQAQRMTGELEIGKINNGDTPDIVFSARDYSAETLEYLSINDLGNGNFEAPSGLFSDTQFPFPADFQLTDIDDDDILDILSTWKDGRFAWYKGDGLGGFNGSGNDIDIPEVDMLSIDKLADMNNDGAVDLICSASIGNWDYPYILFNDGQGSFSNHFQFEEASYYNGSKMALDAGDLDNDGDADLIGLARSSDLIAFFMLNNGDGTFENVVDLDLNMQEGSSPYHKINLADLNGDSDMEVFITYATLIPGCGSHGLPCPYNSFLIFDLDNGQLTLVNAFNSLPFGAYYYIAEEDYIKYDDFNHDGFTDILSISPARTEIQWLLGDGTGFFDETILITDGLDDDFLTSHKLWPVDIDNDLDMDVIALEYDVLNMIHKLWIYENTDQDLDGDNDGYDIVADCDDTNPDIGDVLPPANPGDGAEICEGHQYQFTGHLIPGANYLWIGPNTYVSFQAQPIIENTSSYYSGTYSLVILLNDCVSDTGTVDLNVLAEPSVSIGWNDGVLTSGPGGLSYQWYLNDTIIEGATMQEYSPVESGEYHVVATDADGCSGSSGVVSTVVSGILDQVSNIGIRISPVPVHHTSRLTIEIEEVNDPIQFSIFDIQGRQVQGGYFESNTAVLNMNRMAAGIYKLELGFGDGSGASRLFVVN